MRVRAIREAARGAATLAFAAALAAGAVGLACRERGTPDPAIKMAVSHQPDETVSSSSSSASGGGAAPAAQPQPGQGGGGGEPKVSVPSRLEVPAEVQAAYSGIRLSWKDGSTGKTGAIEVPIGGSAKIPDSGLEVRADVYLPAFTMSADAITSSGTAEENPAARIAISEDGKDLFGGWVFKRFPDVHPFQHPRFSVRLEGGVPANRSAPSARKTK